MESRSIDQRHLRHLSTFALKRTVLATDSVATRSDWPNGHILGISLGSLLHVWYHIPTCSRGDNSTTYVKYVSLASYLLDEKSTWNEITSRRRALLANQAGFVCLVCRKRKKISHTNQNVRNRMPNYYCRPKASRAACMTVESADDNDSE